MIEQTTSHAFGEKITNYEFYDEEELRQTIDIPVYLKLEKSNNLFHFPKSKKIHFWEIACYNYINIDEGKKYEID